MTRPGFRWQSWQRLVRRLVLVSRVPRWALSLLLFALVLDGSPSRLAAAAIPLTGLPPGFVDEAVVTGLWSPRAFAFTPDGRILFAERGSSASSDLNFASIRVYKNAVLLPTRAITFQVCGDGERGFLGLALDPNFSLNGYVYVYYTRQGVSNSCGYGSYAAGTDGPRNRISRVTMVGDTVLANSEKILVDNIPSDTGIHNAGDLHFGLDGYLYASLGNSNLESPLSPSTQPMSQDLTRLGGKLLRILPTNSNPDGYLTTGNPFDTASGAWKCGPPTHPPPPLSGSGSGPCREIFAYGFRNPFRFAIQSTGPATGIPYVGDVGGGAWEELDQVLPGGNFGWPVREGPCPSGVICQPPYQPAAGMLDPVYAYSHTTLGGGAAIIAGDFYTGTLTPYPSQYWNNFFFADVVSGWIRRLRYNSGTGLWSPPEPYFATGGAGIIDMRMGSDGSLYYLDFPTDESAASELRRIRYQSGVISTPVAQLSVSPQGAAPGQSFTFSALGSYDPDNNLPLTYNWDFGDGGLVVGGSQVTVTHTYAGGPPAALTATLVVVNSLLQPSLPVSVTVYPNDPPPTATIILTNTTASGRGLYYASDNWAFGASNARDGSGQPIPPDHLTWAVRFQHQLHWHPFLSGIVGASGTFVPSTTIETDPMQWYRVILSVQDALGQITTICRDVLPATTTITLNTNPPGGLATVVGWGTNPGPWSVFRVVGMAVGITVPSPQQLDGQSYNFASWSNGGPQSQSITVPSAGGIYTASLTAASASALPSSSPTATPSSTPTGTPTSTRTATSTSTRTATSTGTGTATSTGTRTATSTGTGTATSTATGTALATNTSTPTQTSTPTPTCTAIPNLNSHLNFLPIISGSAAGSIRSWLPGMN